MEIKISLKAARVDAELTQDDVAKALQKSRQTIVSWENGASPISARDLHRICKLYGIPKENIRMPGEERRTY